MKFKITKEQYDQLVEGLQSEYVAQDDGSYHLNVEDVDVSKLQNKRDIEAEHRRTAEKNVTRLQNELNTLRDQLKAIEDERNDKNYKDKRASGDIAAIEKSWQDKYDALVASHAAATDELNRALNDAVVGQTSRAMASKLSEVPDLLAPVISSRLRLEMVEGKAQLRVLDAQGQISALTVDELEAEIAGDARFAPVIISSKANGGGSQRQQPGGAGPKKKPSEMTEAELVEWHRRDPAGFSAAVKQDPIK